MAHGCGFGAESRHAAFAGVALARAGARRSSAWGRVLRKSSVGTFRPTRGVSSPADPLVCSSPHSSLGKRPPPTPCNSAAHCSEGSNSLKLLSPCPQKNNTKNLLPGHDKPFALFLPAALTLAPRSSAEVRGGTCGDFYARVSRGNLDLLPRGSARRTGLLRGALACLVSGCRAGGGRCFPPPQTLRQGFVQGLVCVSQGVKSSRLRPEQLGSLGALVCDMEPETITASDPGVLENLKLCSALTGAQRDALNAVLLGGGTVYG